jgi:lipopolysaccharide biosynthesis glycosyltransferase
MNLIFKCKWKKLPDTYNLYPSQTKIKSCLLRYLDVDSIILHFCSEEKPWDKKSIFYDEWVKNLRKADLMDLRNPVNNAKKWGLNSEIWLFTYNLTHKAEKLFTDILKICFPLLHYKLKVGVNKKIEHKII